MFLLASWNPLSFEDGKPLKIAIPTTTDKVANASLNFILFEFGFGHPP
jgi:hypothetical protein